MTPTDFVSALAGVMRVEATELATVDRALAKRGMRKLAKGRARPDISLEEGLQIVFAWASSENLTLAADEVERLRSYYLVTEESSSEERIMPHLFGVSRESIHGMNFLDVAAIATRHLGKENLSATDLWIALTRAGGVDLGFRADNRFGRIPFYPKKFEWGVPQPHVYVTVTIRGPVLKWVYDVTEGA